MSVLRPLPPRPSLEFDRKQAKALLRRLRAGDSEAAVRALTQHPTIDVSAPARIQLADAQLVVAREYGFASWPRLVQYFASIERQGHSLRSLGTPDYHVAEVRSLLAQHRGRFGWAARRLSAYVPRFYGMRVDDVFALAVTEADAQLAVARGSGCPSWDVLLERISAERSQKGSEWQVEPLQKAGKAMETLDLRALQEIVEAYPELLHPSEHFAAKGGTLLNSAIHQERVHGRDAMRPIMEWLASQGQDLQLELNMRLCGRAHTNPDDVRYLLERGADPNWIAPNGISVLEHALLRYRNGEQVDLIAAHVKPRKALWIAAGLGDINGVRSFLDRHGRPTAAAHRYRPPFDAVGEITVPPLVDADDEELMMEAFWVAQLNGRTAVMEYMATRGFNVNSLVWGTPVIHIAVSNGRKAVVECLLRCGADLDLRGWGSSSSAREAARDMYENQRFAERYRPIVELCGLNPDAIIAEYDAKRPNSPVIAQMLQDTLNLASDDAHRRDQLDVQPDNLLFGLLRFGKLPTLYFTQSSRMDRERFHADVVERVGFGNDCLEHAPLPMHSDARAIFDMAIVMATEKRSETVNGLHLLAALLRDEQGYAVNTLTKYGGNLEKLNTDLARVI